jgi:preprotein translocase subunit SecD
VSTAASTRRARRPGSPFRPLLALAALLAVLLGAVAIVGSWTPRLGLDLRGGTSLTLQATPFTGGGQVTNEAMTQAQSIISSRVNGSGVAESSVVRQGRTQIVVQAPGADQSELRRLVGTTAELNFRQVLGIAPVAAAPAPQLTLSPTPSASRPAAPATPAAPAPTGARTSPAAYRPSGPTAGSGRFAMVAALPAAASPTPAPAPAATAPAPAPTAPAPVPGGPALGPTLPAPAPTAPAGTPLPSLGPNTPVAQVLAATISPAVPQAVLTAFDAFTCNKRPAGTAAPAGQFLITCDRDNAAKYLLGPAFIQGTDVNSAAAVLAQQGGGWEINVGLKGGRATDILREATSRLVSLPQDTVTTQPGQPTSNFAIVLDGVVQSAPYIQGAIPGGNASISGSFTQQSAQQLASILKFGALPLRFVPQTAQTTSPTLGGEQLRWGLIAGGVGLLLTIAYAMLYYRALAVVVAGSLVVAAALSYLLVVFLGGRIGYALSLPGIAGFIVSIGITADSFVVYFERLRDEIRDGRSLRTAVETAWTRSRRTILSADFVSLLAAVVLFVLAIQDVRGFAFTLGLTTIVDIVVVFLFTKPFMSLLARTRFFGRGHRWSGLDPEHIGRRLDRPGPGPRGGQGSGGSGSRGTGSDGYLDPADAARARARARAGASALTTQTTHAGSVPATPAREN